ncbi:MAG: RecB family exonuclease [Halanaerobiales bacterium]
MEKYSVSKIKTYDSCALKYKLHYIDKIWPHEIERDDTMFGSLVHKAFEIYDPEKDNKDEIVKLVRDYPTLSMEYKQLLSKAYKSLLEFFDKYGKYPAEQELRIDYPLDNFKMTGYVDRFIHANNFHICVDYKTSKNANIDYHIFQLKFYNLALSKMYDISPKDIKMMVFFPRPNEEAKTMFSNRQMQQFEKELKNKIDEIESNKKWPANPGFHCKWCAFYDTQYCLKTFSGKNSVIT